MQGFGAVARRGSLVGGRGVYGLEIAAALAASSFFAWLPIPNPRDPLYLLHSQGVPRLHRIRKQRNFQATTGLELM